ncbi:alcohol dehydrogenase catalytic domain-containing protein [Fusibacter paucivorans]|uniref:Alcohol dehydrogenase catalytic domain-containing protein n=1 Tax=Fusibacter paucivorans TaxID=76009 RepID=A0ABS5PPB6_9FIRM|nr:alcohol dehydrogenase catalytic domain-containing protein [Fusibacter paucivorans]MBS7527000.1 alcohol dehydrogenase catalytic domain-containing protein [Fusibacter paucivorans]
MKAAIYQEMGRVTIEEIDKPVCGPDDVIVKTIRTGICGSDVNGYFKGSMFSGTFKGDQFGHETAGYITEIGENTSGFKIGMRVWIQPITSTKPGQSNNLGGFSEYVRVPNAKLNVNLYALPDQVSYDEAALIEPFAVGTHGKNVPGAKPGDHVIIYGAGTIGISCLSGICAQGIVPIVIVRNNHKRALIEKIGGIVCNINEVDLVDFVKEKFGVTKHRIGYPAVDVDIVIDCAGASNIVEDFMKFLKPKSKLSIVGVTTEPIPVPMGRLMSSEVIIQGSCGYDHEDIVEVIDNLASKRTYMSEIITHHYPLTAINEAIQMANRRDQAIKVVIDMAEA